MHVGYKWNIGSIEQGPIGQLFDRGFPRVKWGMGGQGRILRIVVDGRDAREPFRRRLLVGDSHLLGLPLRGGRTPQQPTGGQNKRRDISTRYEQEPGGHEEPALLNRCLSIARFSRNRHERRMAGGRS